MNRNTKRILSAVVVIIAAVLGYGRLDFGDSNSEQSSNGATEGRGGTDVLDRAFREGRSDVQVEGRGMVTKRLPDDNDGSRHQRFIVRLESGQTVLVAHNIDVAPRVEGLEEGDIVEFYGEYEWNDNGGVIHWTHHDPDGRHVGGWIKHKGRTYE